MFILQSSVDFLFDKSIENIKNIGSSIAYSACYLYDSSNFSAKTIGEKSYADKDSLFSLFESSSFAIHFFYEFDVYHKRVEKRHSLNDELNLLIAKKSNAKVKMSKLSAKIDSLDKKIRQNEINAHKRLMSKSYCRRKIVTLVMSEMLYKSQLNKEIGADSVYYADSLLVSFRKLQKAYNAELLHSKAISVSGSRKSLASFAIDANRKISELYAKTKGFEQIALENDMDWAFVTITAEGKFHPNPQSSKNKKSEWDKYLTTAKDAHNSLTKRWRDFGKAAGNKGLSMKSGDFFGLRVTEPHKDGCPHWHMLVFYNPEIRELLFHEKEGLFYSHFSHSKHALKITYGIRDGVGNEGVASAASYALKYITKALAGDLNEVNTIDSNLNTETTTNSIERLEAWRAATGIRAYQTFGIPGLSTLWNSVRKISSHTGLLNHSYDVDSDKKRFYIRENVPFDHENHLSNLSSLLSQSDNEILSLSQFDSYGSDDVDFCFSLQSSSLDALSSIVERDNLNIKNGDYYFNAHAVASYEESEGIDIINREISFTIKNNDFSNGFDDAIYAESCFVSLMRHAVAGNWAEFYKFNDLMLKKHGSENMPYSLVRQEYINSYGETEKKVIGINSGMRVYLFKQYTIFNIEPEFL